MATTTLTFSGTASTTSQYVTASITFGTNYLKYIDVSGVNLVNIVVGTVAILGSTVSSYNYINTSKTLTITIKLGSGTAQKGQSFSGKIDVTYTENSFYKLSCPDYENLFKSSATKSTHGFEEIYANVYDEYHGIAFGSFYRDNMIDDSWKYGAEFMPVGNYNYLFRLFYSISTGEFYNSCAKTYASRFLQNGSNLNLLVKGTIPRVLSTYTSDTNIMYNDSTKAHFEFEYSAPKITIIRGVGEDGDHYDIPGFFINLSNGLNYAYTAKKPVANYILFNDTLYEVCYDIFSNLGYVPYCLGCAIWGGGGGGAFAGSGGGGGGIGVLTLDFTTTSLYTIDLGCGGMGGTSGHTSGFDGGSTYIYHGEVKSSNNYAQASGGGGGKNKSSSSPLGGSCAWANTSSCMKQLDAVAWLDGRGGSGGAWQGGAGTKYLENNEEVNGLYFYSLNGEQQGSDDGLGALCSITVGEAGTRSSGAYGGPGGGSFGNGGKTATGVAGSAGNLGGGGGGGANGYSGGHGGAGGVIFWY